MEHWDLYNRDRIPLGRTHERGKPLPEGGYHMVVHVVIFNRQGQMLIQGKGKATADQKSVLDPAKVVW